MHRPRSAGLAGKDQLQGPRPSAPKPARMAVPNTASLRQLAIKPAKGHAQADAPVRRIGSRRFPTGIRGSAAEFAKSVPLPACHAASAPATPASAKVVAMRCDTQERAQDYQAPARADPSPNRISKSRHRAFCPIASSRRFMPCSDRSGGNQAVSSVRWRTARQRRDRRALQIKPSRITGNTAVAGRARTAPQNRGLLRRSAQGRQDLAPS